MSINNLRNSIYTHLECNVGVRLEYTLKDEIVRAGIQLTMYEPRECIYISTSALLQQTYVGMKKGIGGKLQL